MNGPEDNFLSRWSRRKRKVAADDENGGNRPSDGEKRVSWRRGDGPSPHCGETMGEGVSAVERGLHDPTLQGGGGATAPQGGGESAGPAEPLPRLEDLTAESELTAFLRKGVPEALKKAALRRMWSLDPAIRDFVGPAEYAWDYNNPGSIPGFGTVAAETPMARLAAQAMSVGKAADSPQVLGEQGSQPEPPARPAALPQSSLDPSLSSPTRVPSAPGVGREGRREFANRPTLSKASAADSGGSNAGRPEGEGLEAQPELPRDAAASPRHGGAMPR